MKTQFFFILMFLTNFVFGQNSITKSFGNKSVTHGDIAFHDNLTQATFRDTVKRGDDYYFEVVIQNFSQETMNSVNLKYFLSNDPHNYNLVLIDPLNPGEARTLPVLIIPTNDLIGNQVLVLELNPGNVEPETNYENNLLNVPFVVKETTVSSVESVTNEQTSIYNFPNPVVNNTRFNVSLGENFSETSDISLEIYDIKGQLVKVLNNDFFSNNGNGNFTSNEWNVMDESGRTLPSGIYFYNVRAINNQGVLKTLYPKSNIKIVN